MATGQRRLSDWLAGFVQFCSGLESPTQYHIWSGLATVSAALQRKVRLRNPYFTLFPNLYIFIVGPAGIGKTTAADIGVAMLNAATEGAVSITADKITPEALMMEMAEARTIIPSEDEILVQSAIFAYCPEAAVFLGDALHNTSMLALLTRFYECPEGTWRYRTKTAGFTEITNGCLTLLACTTPEWIQKTISPVLIGGGFTSRIIFIYDETQGDPEHWPKVDPSLVTLEQDLVHDLKIIHELQGEFSFDPQALVEYKEWYDTQFYEAGGGDERMAGFTVRLRREHILKVGMVLAACMEDDLVLKSNHLKAAREFLAAAEPTMVESFGYSGRSIIAEDQMMILKEVERMGLVPHSTLLTKYKRHVDKEKLKRIVETLMEAGEVFPYTATRRGGKMLVLGVVGGGAKHYASKVEHIRRVREAKEREKES